MIIKKKKICAGCNEEKFIYKNIDGKKYCMSCTYKLQPPKQIRKMSEKGTARFKLKLTLLEEDKKFYIGVWYNRFGRVEGTGEKYQYEVDNTKMFPLCEACQKRLWWEPNTTYFHHILEKRNYPEFRHVEENIAVLCTECHNKYETFPDSVPYLVKKREELVKKLLKPHTYSLI